MNDARANANKTSDLGFAQWARLRGFADATCDPDVDEAMAISSLTQPMNDFARLLSAASGCDEATALSLCGLRGALRLRAVAPASLPKGIGASFDANRMEIKIAGRPGPGCQPGAHLAHEWAHGLDRVFGHLFASHAHTQPSPSPAQVMDSIAQQAAESPAPYQSALGAMAKSLLAYDKSNIQYASSALASREDTKDLESRLPRFAKIVQSRLPIPAKALSLRAKAFRAEEAKKQSTQLAEFIADTAAECLMQDEQIKSLRIDATQITAIAKFCARAVLARSAQESARRQGREKAMDLAKADIALMIHRVWVLDPESSNRIASAIFHIAPLKAVHDDPFYSAPYTGRASWSAPGSLADLSCALVRVCRNQRALSNTKLSKERFVPMAFWWGMRRHVSEQSTALESRITPIFQHLVNNGALGADTLVHASQWRAERGDYKAGALVFSDLIGTGSKMIQSEADLIGRSIDRSTALGLRKKISAPINEFAQRKTTYELFAESFEQFIIDQSRSKTKLGKTCKTAMLSGLIDTDQDELCAAMDPARSWMSDKDGDVAGNTRRWRALLRDLPQLIIGPAPSTISSVKI
jgi:hypothetical protein